MLKKITAFSLSTLFLGCGFGFVKAAPVHINSDEEMAARIQNQEMLKYNPRRYSSRSTRHQISQVRAQISKNEASIKILEAKRSQLDRKLAIKMRLQESTNSWFERVKLSREIENISYEIDLNESKIESLKDERSDLDYKLAVLLQLQEK